MRLTLDDSTLSVLEPQILAGHAPEGLVELAVSRIGHIPKQARFLLLTENDVTALETRLGAPVIGTVQDLHRAVDQLVDLQIQRISLRFTPAQYRELKDRADREGMTPEEYARRVVYAMSGQFFVTAPLEPPELVTSGGKRK